MIHPFLAATRQSAIIRSASRPTSLDAGAGKSPRLVYHARARQYLSRTRSFRAHRFTCSRLLTLLALLFGGKLAAADLFNDPSGVPEVLTATRLKQSPAEVPGSISVLDRELIVASGARDIPELMRLVPGMMVGYLSGNQPTVNYHGTSMSGARRLQVLIDGRSVYRPGLASVDWSDLPLALEDVERIEVFRGPNTVSYGANALMG